MPRRSLLALALVATMALGACGSTPTGSATPSPGVVLVPPEGSPSRDWCLNTVEEVSAAIGGTAVTALGGDAPGVGGACTYSTTDRKLVYTVATIDNEAAASTFNGARSGEGVVQISGIGDEAILMSPLGPLAILKDKAFISLAFLPDAGITDANEMRTKLEQLGRAAADRY